MKPGWFMLATFSVALGLAWYLWPEPESISVQASNQNTRPKRSQPGAQPAQWPPAPAYVAAPDVQRVPIAPVNQTLSARDSLADARWHGDARTPPIERSVDNSVAPTPAELADPKAYAAYEARHNLRVYAAFVQAAQQAIPKLQADIERGRQAGIAPEKIAKVEEKVRRIVAEQTRLVQQYPELANPANPASTPLPPRGGAN